MSDIFLSYASEDLISARPLAKVLEQQGWSVFWDRTIPPGKTWREFIEAELDAAKCMVVLWSANSIASEWVLEEADTAKSRRILVPALIQQVSPPLGFRAIQAADLTGWDGGGSFPAFQQLVVSVRRTVDPTVDKATPQIETSGNAQAENARVAANLERPIPPDMAAEAKTTPALPPISRQIASGAVLVQAILSGAVGVEFYLTDKGFVSFVLWMIAGIAVCALNLGAGVKSIGWYMGVVLPMLTVTVGQFAYMWSGENRHYASWVFFAFAVAGVITWNKIRKGKAQGAAPPAVSSEN